MILVGNCLYKVTLRTAPLKSVTVILVNCGGNCAGRDGHWVGGGVWASTRNSRIDHRNSKIYEDLPVLCIRELTDADRSLLSDNFRKHNYVNERYL